MPQEEGNAGTTAQLDDEIENVRVVVRTRPMDKNELSAGALSAISVDKINRAITVMKPNATANEPPKTYYFDNVFDGGSNQMDLYVDTARPIVDKVLEGYNGTILAYGQTGTGKTYTMSGNPDSPQTKGIIPNAFAHIFGHIAKAKENQKFLVRVSYMEIYNEEVRDLLGKDVGKSLEVKERPDIGVFVKDLSGYVVHNADDLENIMRLGNKNRAVGATKMNQESSRSHAIFSITVERSELGEGDVQHVRMGKLQLVDLAGSERQSKTQASGQRLKEATKINLSLSVLGNVISALVDGKSTHIPYRNSKLTRHCSTAQALEEGDVLEEEPPSSEEEEDTADDELEAPLEIELESSTIQAVEKKPKKKREKTDAEKEELAKRKNEHQKEIEHAKTEQETLRNKLVSLEGKILVGGENLLEKAQTQELLLEQSIAELEQHEKSEEALKQTLQQKATERIDIEERYSTLQDASTGITKKIHRVMQMLMGVKSELADQQQEHQREKEGIYENIRSLSRELALCELVLNSYVPKEYQSMINQYTHWNEDIGEWQLKCVAYTGNNMRKHISAHKTSGKEPDFLDLSHVYLSYNTDGVSNPMRSKSARPRTSGVPRPTTARRY
ncbi:GM13923 [Drosophila sechellia]|uniref:Kinesin-like protein n=1 Tax=Drosophila sechellia TaxID=7238 RepID=B4HUE8_DROSE|nr:GM13923 [Drosophila sechellia]